MGRRRPPLNQPPPIHLSISPASPLSLPWRRSPLQHRRRPQPWPPPPLPSLARDPLPPPTPLQSRRWRTTTPTGDLPPSLPPEIYGCGNSGRNPPIAHGWMGTGHRRRIRTHLLSGDPAAMALVICYCIVYCFNHDAVIYCLNHDVGSSSTSTTRAGIRPSPAMVTADLRP
uniref:Uncharacterized protein n=1 Tax=Triticum urartu TaxID=4572 RepID=A0A8R7PLF2_TRIUA